jgi:phosphoribosylanthranilate isomerase
LTKIKICGFTREDEIECANIALPDYAGFVFAPSRRQVTPVLAGKLRQRLDPRVVTVGVFVNADTDAISRLYLDGVIAMAQLHGGEDHGTIERLKSRGVPVIQAIRAGRGDTMSPLADFYLLDGYNGGAGRTFDWGAIPQTDKPYLLAGGIDAENIAAALALQPYAVDISSGAETDGVKNLTKIDALVRSVRREA